MEVSARTGQAALEGAGRCQSKRRRVILDDPLGGRLAVEAAFAEWRDEWGQHPRVKLLFTATDLPIFDYVDG